MSYIDYRYEYEIGWISLIQLREYTICVLNRK